MFRRGLERNPEETGWRSLTWKRKHQLAVLEFVRGHPGASIIQIHRALDLNYYRVGMHLEQLEILGFMRSKPHRFLLPWWRSERSQKLHAHHYVLSEIRPRDPETAYLVHLIHSTREWVFPEDTT